LQTPVAGPPGNEEEENETMHVDTPEQNNPSTSTSSQPQNYQQEQQPFNNPVPEQTFNNPIPKQPQIPIEAMTLAQKHTKYAMSALVSHPISA